jgi:hypothetical protein
MMRRLALVLMVVVVVSSAASCGGEGTDAVSSTSTTSTTTNSARDPRAQLEDAVREAVEHDHRDSVRSLWTNHVPAHPTATGGPALAQWRRSVTARARRGIRVRTLSQRFRIVSIRLHPSYASAVAIVADDQRVQPSRRNGKPIGRTVVLHERARLELRRVGRSERFVVWTVEGLRR